MRPIGLTLICLYQMLRGLTGLVFGLFIVCYTGPSNQFVARASQGNAAERLMASFGHAAGLAIVVFAVVHLLAGYGVLRRQNWGRILTLLLSAVELVLILPSRHPRKSILPGFQPAERGVHSLSLDAARSGALSRPRAMQYWISA